MWRINSVGVKITAGNRQSKSESTFEKMINPARVRVKNWQYSVGDGKMHSSWWFISNIKASWRAKKKIAKWYKTLGVTDANRTKITNRCSQKDRKIPTLSKPHFGRYKIYGAFSVEYGLFSELYCFWEFI